MSLLLVLPLWLSPLAECTLLCCSLFWAFTWDLCISACTYSHSLSFFSLVSQRGSLPFKENSIRSRKQSVCFTAPSQESVAGWPQLLHPFIFQKVLGSHLLPGTNCIDRYWCPSSFPIFNHSLWWQRNLSEHEAGKQPGKGVKQLKKIMDKGAWIHLAWEKLTKLLLKGKHSYYSLFHVHGPLSWKSMGKLILEIWNKFTTKWRSCTCQWSFASKKKQMFMNPENQDETRITSLQKIKRNRVTHIIQSATTFFHNASEQSMHCLIPDFSI